MKSILSVTNLCKQYPGFSLENVNFCLKPGEIIGLIGRNGAGKTTTLKSLLNMTHPSSGEILFFDKSFSQAEMEIKSRTGFVSGGVDFYMRKKLRVVSQATRRFYPQWEDRVYRRYMERFELDENKTPAQLSAGMRVKYNLVLALSHHAELLILDEPTSGLDPFSREEVLDILISLAQEGTGILFSTHITSDLERCADRIVYLRRGRVLANDALDAFVQSYRLTRWPEETPPAQLLPHVIGLKQAKHGYTALIKAADLPVFPASEPADLDSIMIHLEKETEDEKLAL